MIIAKIINKNQIESTYFDDRDVAVENFLKIGFKPLIMDDSVLEQSTFQKIEYEYTDMGDSIQQNKIVANNYQSEIAWNKEQLTALDWKTVRNTMAEKAGVVLPLSWEDIYNETQRYRDRINYLENLI